MVATAAAAHKVVGKVVNVVGKLINSTVVDDEQVFAVVRSGDGGRGVATTPCKKVMKSFTCVTHCVKHCRTLCKIHCVKLCTLSCTTLSKCVPRFVTVYHLVYHKQQTDCFRTNKVQGED